MDTRYVEWTLLKLVYCFLRDQLFASPLATKSFRDTPWKTSSATPSSGEIATSIRTLVVPSPDAKAPPSESFVASKTGESNVMRKDSVPSKVWVRTPVALFVCARNAQGENVSCTPSVMDVTIGTETSGGTAWELP